MSSWVTAVSYGAAGGLITEAVDMWGRLRAWQQARHAARSRNLRRRPPPSLARFVDPVPDLAVAFTRALLGCAAGWLLHDEITGMYAALAVGASAPALLAGLGKATTPAEALSGQPGGRRAPAAGRIRKQEADAQPQAVE
jgi:hypothetical protein